MIRAVICALLLMIVPVSAASDYDAGLISSDSPLWKLDLALERLQERIQLDEDARAQMQMKHAEERIGEMMQSDDPTRAIEEYDALIARIQSNTQLRYETANHIQERMTVHAAAIGSMPKLMNAQAATSQLQHHAQTMKSEQIQNEQAHWSDMISKYNIPDIPVSIEDTFGVDMSSVHSLIPTGISIVSVTTSDGSVLNEYTIRNGDKLQISKNAAMNYDNAYTMTVNDVMRYTERYGKVVGYED